MTHPKILTPLLSLILINYLFIVVKCISKESNFHWIIYCNLVWYVYNYVVSYDLIAMLLQ